MRTLAVSVAKDQLDKLLAGAERGDMIVLTDGERKLAVETISPHGGGGDLNLEEDSAELEAELLGTVNGPHAPFSETELRGLADRALREYRSDSQK